MLAKTGSVKRGIVSPDLLNERAKCNFDQKELGTFLMGGKEREAKAKEMYGVLEEDPTLRNSIEFYDMTPHEMQEQLWERINVLYKRHKKEFFEDAFCQPPYIDWNAYIQGLLPGVGLTVSMFRISVENLSNAEQKAYWLPKI